MSDFEKSSQDLVNQNPPVQEGMTLEQGKYSAFALSLQGASHVGNNVPCQDYNALRYVKGADILIAAIADGVGSCTFSHWGAYQAVTSVVDYVEQELLSLSGGKRLKLDDSEPIRSLLHSSFMTAWQSVMQLSDESGILSAETESTLTLVLYDGEAVFCAHAGDDGVVVQYQDGTVKMLTKRLKGEEASSVYPLQSGESHWGYYAAGVDDRGPVVGFVMATDGVLDGFVYEDPEYLNAAGCCNGVFYPFMVRSIYNVESRKKCDPRNAQETLDWYKAYMQGSSYRQRITDDLTFVSVINPKLVKKAVLPAFSRESWDASTKAIVKRREKIYPGRVPEKDEQDKQDEQDEQDEQASAGTDVKEGDEALTVETHKEPPQQAKQIALNIPPKYLWLAFGVLIGVALSTAVTLALLNRPAKSEQTDEPSSSQVTEDSSAASSVASSAVSSSESSSAGEDTQGASSPSNDATIESQAGSSTVSLTSSTVNIFTCINTGAQKGENSVAVSTEKDETNFYVYCGDESLPPASVQFRSTLPQIQELSEQGIQNIKFIAQGTCYSFSVDEILNGCVGEPISVSYDESGQAILTREVSAESTIPGTLEDLTSSTTGAESGSGNDTGAAGTQQQGQEDVV